MAVVELILNGPTVGITRDFQVEGTTYSPSDGVIVGLQAGVLDKNLLSCAEIVALCNDAGLMYKGHQFRATGLPTEAALKVSFLLCISDVVYDALTVYVTAVSSGMHQGMNGTNIAVWIGFYLGILTFVFL
jgi:hypothetical protein